MNVVILDDYQDAVRRLPCAARLDPYPTKAYTNTCKGIGQLESRLKETDIVILTGGRTKITRPLLKRLPRLKLIAQAGCVGEHIDIEACTQHRVAIADGVSLQVATAEFTWALIMAAMRRIPQYVSNLKQGIWQQSGLKAASMPPNFGLGMLLRGKTLGIFGYGHIGQLVAGYGRAFGMNVRIWGREASRARAMADGLPVAATREDFFAECDVLSLHLALNDETRASISLQDLSLMKPTALLVNTAYAELLEPEALAVALGLGRPGMAAVDVFENAPIAQGHSLLRLENCLCTPHISSVEQDTYDLYFGAAIDNLINFIHGTPTNIINPEVLDSQK